MVDFYGWMMLLYYGFQIDEYYVVCGDVGMFDVLYMIIVDFYGSWICEFLCYLLVNDVVKFIISGKVFYIGMLIVFVGVIDDLIVYFFFEDYFCFVVNFVICEKDFVWIFE